LAAELRGKGYSVLQADGPPDTGGGILSFHEGGKDPAVVHQKLAEANIVASLRVDRAGRRYVRLSPHFYNTDAELRRVVELL
jgi:selenocysteine lyase/cysteine desulfurase